MYETIDGQVCFHRQSISNPVKPRRSTTESMGPLMGTNKAAWGVKLLLMVVWSYQVDCGSFCALLTQTHIHPHRSNFKKPMGAGFKNTVK